MEKQNIKKSILDLLQRSRFGLNVKNLKDKLGYSRTTIAKYLTLLQEEDMVVDREIGQYHIWLHKDTFYGKNKKINSLIFAIYWSMLRNMEKDTVLNINPADIKRLGKNVASDFNFSDLFDIKPQENAEPEDFHAIAKVLMDVIDSICKFYDSYSWRPPIIIKEKNTIIVRMYDSDLIKRANFHFYMLSGFIEHEMNKFIECSVNVIQIDENERIVDYQFDLTI
jgi:hypothetical protein